MKLIKDIRLFELDVPNVDYNPTPYYIGKIYHYDHMDCKVALFCLHASQSCFLRKKPRHLNPCCISV